MDWEGEGRDGEDDFDFFDKDEEASAVTESESVHPRQKVFVSEPTSDFEEVFCVSSIEIVADLVAVFVLEFGNPMMKRQMCGSACEHANVASVLLVG